MVNPSKQRPLWTRPKEAVILVDRTAIHSYNFIDEHIHGVNGTNSASCSGPDDSPLSTGQFWSRKQRSIDKCVLASMNDREMEWASLQTEFNNKLKGNVGIIPSRQMSLAAGPYLNFKKGYSNSVTVETDNPNMPVWAAEMVPSNDSKVTEVKYRHQSRNSHFAMFALLDYLIGIDNLGFIQDRNTSREIKHLNKGMGIGFQDADELSYRLGNLTKLPFTVSNVMFFWESNFVQNHIFTVDSGMKDSGMKPLNIHLIEDDAILELETKSHYQELEKKMKNKHQTVESLMKKVGSNQIATVQSCFVNRKCEAVAFTSSTYVDTKSQDYDALIDTKHPNHRFVIRSLFLNALKQAKTIPSQKSGWTYRVIVTNGNEYEVEGLMEEMGKVLFFDRYDENGKAVDNGCVDFRLT